MVSLNEYKNISDDVYQFSVDLYHKILNDADIRQMQKSRVNGFLFVQNTLLLNNTNVKWIFNNIDSLKVNYILYVSETTKEYNYIMQNIDADANSESDYDNKSITIVSGYIDDYISPDFLSNICHEVNHLYEYDNGREKRVDLYDKVRELIAMKNNDAYIVGNAFYYSFQHEIDAFVHQFYGFLKQEKPNHLDFEQLLNYSEYMNALSAYKFVYNKRNDKKVMNWINYLGYDRKFYFKRLKYSLKKLFTKIKNAYLRYKVKNRKMTEGAIHRLQKNEKIRLEECKKYNQDITWGLEIIYNF